MYLTAVPLKRSTVSEGVVAQGRGQMGVRKGYFSDVALLLTFRIQTGNSV